jgi:hypothetical protein
MINYWTRHSYISIHSVCSLAQHSYRLGRYENGFELHFMSFFPAVLSFLFCPGCLNLAVCADRPILAALSWLACPGSPIITVLFCLSFTTYFVLYVLFWLFSPFCPLLAVLPWLSYTDIQVLTALFCLSCSACPVLPVLFWLFYIFSSALAVILAVLSWQP